MSVPCEPFKLSAVPMHVMFIVKIKNSCDFMQTKICMHFFFFGGGGGLIIDRHISNANYESQGIN